MRAGTAAWAAVAIAFAIASSPAFARGSGGGGHGGGGHGGGGHAGIAGGAHVSSFSGGHVPRASFGGTHFNQRPAFVNRRIIVAAPVIFPPYYSPYYGYDPFYDPAAYYEPSMYGTEPLYGSPPAPYYPAPPPPPAPSSPSPSLGPERSAQSAAPVSPTPIYYCAQSHTYSDTSRETECPGGWRRVTL